jgi:hypothetical protein
MAGGTPWEDLHDSSEWSGAGQSYLAVRRATTGTAANASSVSCDARGHHDTMTLGAEIDTR